ncbi:MAG: XRE family transcriptional regulator [Alphaproteobacteria bacterium]
MAGKARTIDEVMDSWPAERRARVEARAQALAAEYLTLQDLRKAHALTQERMAELLDINQENVSRLEKRSDLLISTLRGYIEAMGGKLSLVAEFPNRPPVILDALPGLDETNRPGRSGRRKPAAGHATAS